MPFTDEEETNFAQVAAKLPKAYSGRLFLWSERLTDNQSPRGRIVISSLARAGCSFRGMAV